MGFFYKSCKVLGWGEIERKTRFWVLGKWFVITHPLQHQCWSRLEIKLDYKALSIKNHFALLETYFVLLFQRWKNFFERNYIDLFYGNKCLFFKRFRIWGSMDLHFSLEFEVGMWLMGLGRGMKLKEQVMLPLII